LEAVTGEPGISLVGPSEALKLAGCEGGGRVLQLESPNCPVPVKKQRKYNLARWAVTGRDNTAINGACERIYRGMLECPDANWKELCYLWASDFRTHLTQKRWTAFKTRLQAAESRYAQPLPACRRGWIAAVAWRSKNCISPAMPGQHSEACRMAPLRTSRFRPIGTRVIACLKHRAKPKSQIWNGARRELRIGTMAM
jgi:hypothetical protein